MYICAQRVRRPERQGGSEGINAFFYVHRIDPWGEGYDKPILPERNPGSLVDSAIEVAPPGNAVRSYLDVVSRDDVTLDRIIRAIRNHPAPKSFPVEWSGDAVWCRIGVDFAMESGWENELEQLMARIVILLARQVPAY
jgi:hypothetical protein